MKQAYLFITLFLFFPLFSQGHPVSFEGSKGVMGYHSPMVSHLQLNYSFKHWFALGVHHFQAPMSVDRYSANFISTNFLIKRWNGEGFQANIYAVAGFGHSEIKNNSKGAMLSKLQFDIEDRNYYFLASHSQINSLCQRHLTNSIVRLGLAPYVANYDDIHSWIILEWSALNRLDQRSFEDLTPFLRIFYKNILFEIGQSFSGLTRFNYIIHF